MKVSYVEGLATHNGSESCVGVREDEGEALTGVRAGRVLSREIHEPPRERWTLRGADVLEDGGRPHCERRQRKAPVDPARSETPCMPGSTAHGNREVPRLPASEGLGGPLVRVRKAGTNTVVVAIPALLALLAHATPPSCES